MKILLVGGGGREHAIAWRLWRSPSVTEIVAVPGNPGMESIATCVKGSSDVRSLVHIAEQSAIELTVVGPEAPLVAGIVDEFRARHLPIIGPTQAASRLEGSKIFAKEFFGRAGIPTARSVQTSSAAEALQALDRFTLPVVIKADGLAAGKGVVVASTREEAEAAIEKLGPLLVVEEYLDGREVSFIALCDGSRAYPLPPTQDHKRLADGDRGPNTGGMGAYCDSNLLSAAQSESILDRIMLPALAQMAKEGTPFTGFLYAGLMLTDDGPKLLEFNVRLGDPETQTIACSTSGDFAQFLQDPEHCSISFEKPSVCVVLASDGYPDVPRTGDVIAGISEAEQNGAVVFQAGTRVEGGQLVTAGGRVLGVTASGATLRAAALEAYKAVGRIHFEGMQYRRDIGQKATAD